MQVNYRPEIDGLRAIAVISVILYHTQFILFDEEIFKGGFIGVDIFFVISGYLISSIILKEFQLTGSFSFKNFYERRVRRILPALLVVMVFSFPIAWLYLLPKNFIEYSESILYSLGFSSNFYFWSLGGNYEDTNSLLKPFLHTWSLSVEEQFYIVFPIIILIAYKFFKKYLISILILSLFLSLFISDFGSKNYPGTTFYFLPTRGWELLAGSILSYLEIKKGHRGKNTSLNSFLPSIGILLVIHSIFFFNDQMYHPSLLTISPIIGVCLIIWFSDKNEIVTKILSSKIFVGIGLISYSLYLWHYPILAFDKISDFSEDDFFNKLVIVFLIISCSICSYYLVERPARNRNNSFKKIILWLFLTFFVLIFLNFKVIINNGYDSRLPEIIIKSLNKSKNENDEIFDINLSSNKKIYLIGDSHVFNLGSELKSILNKNNYEYHPYILNECIYFPGFDRIRIKTNKKTKLCSANYFEKVEKDLLAQKDAIFIFGGRYPVVLEKTFFNNQEGGIEDDKQWKYKFKSNGKFKNINNSFRESLLKLSENNKIILIYPIPEVGWNVQQKVFNKFPENIISTSYEVYKNRTKSSFKLLDSIKGENIFRVFPDKIFCNTSIKGRCVTHDKKNIFYHDDNHLSLIGAEMLNQKIIKKINVINGQ